MLKQKGVKAIIISLLVILSTTCFSLLFTNVYKTFTKEEPQAATAWALENGDIENQYANYDTFTISAPDTLNYFLENVSAGYTFEDKEVKLLADINCSGKTMLPAGGKIDDGVYSKVGTFKGVFDGGNFTISNLTFSIPRGPQSTMFGVGLFSELSGEAKVNNVRLNNYSITVDMSDNDKGYSKIGAIAGFVAGDDVYIYNCLVNKFNVTIKNNEDGLVAGLVGRVQNSDLTINECLVKDFTITSDVKLESVAGFVGETYYSKFNPYNPNSVSSVYMYDCHLLNFTFTGSADHKANLSPARGDLLLNLGGATNFNDSYFSYKIINCVVQVSNDFTNIHSGYQIKHDDTTYVNNIYSDSNYAYNTDTFENLYMDSTGGSSCDSIWYYGGDNYNGGYPYLRGFITWSTINIQTSGNGSVTLSSIKIPSELFNNFHNYVKYNIDNSTNISSTSITATSNSKSITIYEQEILPTDGAGFVFKYWTFNLTRKIDRYINSGGGDGPIQMKASTSQVAALPIPVYGNTTSVTITANFEKETYNIKFGGVFDEDGNDVSYTILKGATTFDESTTIPVQYFDAFSISSTESSSEGTQIAYTFKTDVYTISVDYKYEWDKSTRTIDGEEGNISKSATHITDYGAHEVAVTIKTYVKIVEKTITISDVAGANKTVTDNVTSVKVARGTTITPTYSASEAKYTIIGTDSTTYVATYTPTELYEISSAASVTVNSDCSISPTTRQIYKYIVFNKAKIGANESSYTATLNTDNLITTSNATYLYKVEIGESITGTMPSDGINNQTLTYEGSKAFATYSGISAIYRLSSAGIDTSDSNIITVQPVLEEKYVVVNFQMVGASYTTDNTAIGPSGGNAVYSVLMDKSEKTLGASLSGNEIRLTYKLDGVEQIVTYNISKLKNMYYINTSNMYTMEESGTPRSVNVVITIKTYTIIFG